MKGNLGIVPNTESHQTPGFLDTLAAVNRYHPSFHGNFPAFLTAVSLPRSIVQADNFRLVAHRSRRPDMSEINVSACYCEINLLHFVF